MRSLDYYIQGQVFVISKHSTLEYAPTTEVWLRMKDERGVLV